jgi:transposase
MASSPSQKRYPPELRERAVRMVMKAIGENHGEPFGVVTRVARQLGVGVESLRNWVRQAEVDGGGRPGVTSEERRRVAELERENRELRRANEILKAAALSSTGRCNRGWCGLDREVGGWRRGDGPGLTPGQKRELWSRWRAGNSLSEIGRALGKQPVRRTGTRCPPRTSG